MTYDDYYAQVYYFENGNRGTMIIPKDATEDDLLALKGILDIIIKRHYKVDTADTPQTERKSCKLELFDDDGNYIETSTNDEKHQSGVELKQTDCPQK